MISPQCRVCGCTEERACPVEGGCYWVEDTLCSGCAREEYMKHGMTLTPETNHVLLNCGIELALRAGEASVIVAALQLACRHPGLKGQNRQIAEAFARQIQASIALTPQLKFMLDLGWDTTCDVETVPQPEPSRIILP